MDERSVRPLAVTLTQRNIRSFVKAYTKYAIQFGEEAISPMRQARDSQMAEVEEDDENSEAPFTPKKPLKAVKMNTKSKESLKALATLLCSISRESEDIIEARFNDEWTTAIEEGNLLEVWKCIYATHHVANFRDALTARNKLMELQQSGPLARYINNFNDLKNDLADAQGTIPSENELIQLFINGLNDRLKSKAYSWIDDEAEIETIQELIKKLSEYERNYNSRKSRNNAMVAPVKLPVKHNSNQRPEANHSKNVRCNYCHIPGHDANSCRRLMRDRPAPNAPFQKPAQPALFVAALDTGAARHMIQDPALATKTYAKTTTITGVNGIPTDYTKCGIIKDIGEAVIAPDVPFNLISFGKLKREGFQIKYDDDQTTFHVSKNDEPIANFTLDRNNIFRGNISPADVVAVAIDPKAVEARELHRKMCHVSNNTIKTMINNGLLPNTKVKPEDLDLADRVLGKCEVCIRAKTTQPPSLPQPEDPETQIGMRLHMDIAFIGEKRRKLTFLVAVDAKTGYIMVRKLKSKTKKDIELALLSVIAKISSHGHKTRFIVTDSDTSFISSEKDLADVGINLTTRSPYRHEKIVERYIRTLKNRVRCAMTDSGEDYELLPFAIQYAADMMNCTSNSKCPESTPRKEVTGMDVRHRDFAFRFGQKGFIPVPTEKLDSDLQDRASPAVYLSSPEYTLGYEVYDCESDKVVYRHHFIPAKEEEAKDKDKFVISDNTTDEENEDEDFVMVAPTSTDEEAIATEINNLLTLNVFEYASTTEAHQAIPSHIILKDKYDANGNFVKKKARLVAGGNHQQPGTYEDCVAYTVAKQNILLLLSIAAKNNYLVGAVDVPAAYLHAPLDRSIYMYLEKRITNVLVSRDPSLLSARDDKGRLLVKLNKSLYGLKQSGHQWQQYITSKLQSVGLQQSLIDPCIFWKKDLIVAIHVDDVLVAAKTNSEIDTINKALQEFGTEPITIKEKFDYLGIKIKRNRETYTLSQVGFLDKLFEEYSCKEYDTPARTNLTQSHGQGEPMDKKEYLSLNMKLMYLAKCTRPDILFPITYLASKSQPNRGDYRDLLRVTGYLKHTRDKELIIGKYNKVVAYIDASHNTHHDHLGQSGCVLTAGGTVFARSSKQKMVTRSSCESEIVSLYDHLPYILEVQLLIAEITSDTTPIVVFQDNQATITLAESGMGTSGKSRFLNHKLAYIKDQIMTNKISLTYLPTDEMVADVLTKPLSIASFTKHATSLLQGTNKD